MDSLNIVIKLFPVNKQIFEVLAKLDCQQNLKDLLNYG